MVEPISTGLAAGWIAKLVDRLSDIKGERQKEVDEIVNTFGCDPSLLAQYYIEPDCQPNNPADHDEEDPIRAFRTPVREWINSFLKGKFRSLEFDGRNVVFVLGDAGMGKTSLLIMLKFTHMLNFWPDDTEFLLLKIGADTIKRIKATSNRRNTVLLLDALDEDRAARMSTEDRLLQLFEAGKGFRNIFVTCRTQFFPEGRIEGVGKIEVGGYVCNLVYLSLFNDAQVEEYLTKKYRKAGELARAMGTVTRMKSLKMRPLVLSYIEDLEGADLGDSVYAVYEALVMRWLWREERKLHELQGKKAPSAEELWRVCETLALELQAEGKREIELPEIHLLIESQPAVAHLRSLDVTGRSLLNMKGDGSFRFAHYSIQEFLVVHSLARNPNCNQKRLQSTDLIWELLRERISLGEKQEIGRILEKLTGKADLRGADLFQLHLPRVSMHKADLRKTNLTEADLRGADLSEANLQESYLERADLRGADLSGANLRGVNLQGANLQRANLQGTNLEKANLQRANLQESHFVHADLGEAILIGASLQGAILQKAVLERADLRGANLRRANLRESNLLGADLQGANLRRSSLQGAYLRCAHLTGADLRGADLSAVTEIDLGGAIIDQSTRLPTYLRDLSGR